LLYASSSEVLQVYTGKCAFGLTAVKVKVALKEAYVALRGPGG
jgi:hypothetical protein